MKKIVTVVGARPQFVKSATVSLALQEAGIEEILVHTGQHYDANMSAIFFEQLHLPEPTYNLQIGSGSHGYQTGEALKGIEAILEQEKPDTLLVYGDTNATLSGALAAVKLHIPIAHVEAGLRSFNRQMPEEINRVLTDHIATWLFTPTETANQNLAQEGITQGVHWVGDVMLDAVQLFSSVAERNYGDLLKALCLEPQQYLLLTMHRAETTAHPSQVGEILKTLDALGQPVVFPVHPRIRGLVESLGPYQHIQLLEPVSYFEMLLLEKQARVIVTDSGGVQKEAAFVEVPCITLRSETEWVETVDFGWNQLVGLCPQALQQALGGLSSPAPIHHLYGHGQARQKIVERFL